ncbi:MULTISPECIES: hypothetical protein [unclassified Curtobacterium]|uniref:hypothetical protein n=1 Tax=unclassified Curtobacterium TaxID=257496 RepID=UPI0011B5FC81|nr:MULTISPECIES: hypothetical protein [unclassified Curtobacterium]
MSSSGTRLVRARSRRGRLTALGVVLTVVAAPLAVVTVSAAAPAHAATEPVVGESPDYASETFQDPWDFSDAADYNTDLSGPGTYKVANGQLSMNYGTGGFISLVDTVSGSLAYGRDGAAAPINTSRYQRLSFEMNTSSAGSGKGIVYWYTCREKTSSCLGGTTFNVTAGDHVYDIPLNGTSNQGSKIPWTSAKVVALRVQPIVTNAAHPTVSATLNWVRLHGGTTTQAAMPPGDHGTYRVEPMPEPVVDSPSPADGKDLATVQRGKPWEFTSSANASGVTLQNARLIHYGSDGLTAQNQGPNQGDPQVHLPVQKFSANQYHYLTFDLTYDGGFSLASAAGGGKMARVIWYGASTSTPQIGNDILTFSGANAREVAIDMTAVNPLDETALNPKVGWAGQVITGFRFDPNEDKGAAVWHLKSIHLRNTPAATGSTTVKFHDAAWVAGTTADVKVGTSANGSGYTTIASGVPVQQGTNATTFSLGSMAAGTYHVEVVLHHPNSGNALAFSSAPVIMSKAAASGSTASATPKGSFDTLTATSGGATARGWAWDPDQTSSTEVRLYDQTSGSKYLGSVTTSIARSDVARAVAGAPANTGWSTTVSLAKGTHKVCAYAINQGGGSNPTLGCKSVTVG